MNTDLFSDAMSELNEKYIVEAATFQRKAKSTFQIWMSRAACFFLAVILTGSAVLTFSVEARAAFFGWVRQQYGIFYEYFFEGNPEITEPLRYQPGWMPESCEFVTSYETAGGEVYIYTNENDAFIQFSYTSEPNNETLFVDGVEYLKEEAIIHDRSGEFYIAQEGAKTNGLIWTDETETVLFFVSGNYDKETLVKIAENIQVQE